MTQRAAIYVRVDTSKQVDCRHSLSHQIKNCKKFAEEKGFVIVGIYQGEISGAKPITSRLGGRQLQRAISKENLNVVIVYRVDRLSRNISDLLKTAQSWFRSGVAIYALDTGQITTESKAKVWNVS